MTQPRETPAAETETLEPPGAGLPAFELFLSRVGFRLSRLVTSRQAAEARFLEEGDRILTLVRAMDPTLAARPVLIPRLWGIEDSSRHWSALMVLEHLIIVNKAIATIVEHLTAGKTFPREVSIAAVKPSRSQDPAVIERFAGVVGDYVVRVGACRSLRSEGRHGHPWFGPLDAHGWHCLAAIHQTIHRRQIEAIILRGSRTT
jgi:hypothetical protein